MKIVDPERYCDRGFSLIELLLAIVIVLGVVGAMFQLFVQSERLMRDREVLLETQQSARAVAAMIADEIFMGGQGVPLYAARFDTIGSEATEVFLPGTDASRLRLRTQSQNTDTVLGTSGPSTFEAGVRVTAQTLDPGFRPAVGHYVFLWGQSTDAWTWIRARVEPETSPSGLALTPVQFGTGGNRFVTLPRVSEEYAVSFRLSGRSIMRGELRNLSDLNDPLFRELSVGDDFVRLEFVYYDGSGRVRDPATLAGRRDIRRVDFVLEAEGTATLSDGRRPHFIATMTATPRNLEILP